MVSVDHIVHAEPAARRSATRGDHEPAEVVDRLLWRDAQVMRHGLALAYYNPYFLLHSFTAQRLLPHAAWLEIFAEAGLQLLATEYASELVDSTRLEIGYLLRAAQGGGHG